MTHYEVLQISPNASPEMVEVAWKTLMRLYHPDGKEPNAKKAVRINQAHDVLSDPAKRKAYDLSLKSKTPRVQPIRPASPIPPIQEIRFDPGAAISEAAYAAGQSLMNRVIDDNPWLKELLDAQQKRRSG